MTVPSSLVVMVPSPSLSKSENASLNSADDKKKEAKVEVLQQYSYVNPPPPTEPDERVCLGLQLQLVWAKQ